VALILIADNDSVLGEALQRQYQRHGHQALVAHSARDAIRLAEEYGPDAVVLSQALPNFGAAEVFQCLRASSRHQGTPVLSYALSVQLSEDPLVVSQRLQATVPSPLREVALRTVSVLERDGERQGTGVLDDLMAGRLVLRARDLTVESSGRVTRLTRTEFELLRYLMLHVDEACSSRRLLQQVWGYPPGTGSTDVVRTHIRNLRQKIEDRPEEPVFVRTIRNCGYMLCSNGHQELAGAFGTESDRQTLPFIARGERTAG
jgi:DNA-binding response OmpR family regulator